MMGQVNKEKTMGIILQILGVLSILMGILIMSVDLREPSGHKFILGGILVIILGRNSRRIGKLEKVLKKGEES